ncbi:MAG: RHS repeat domain-containing protein [Pyrinomonadaceae bacterium]
MRFPLEQALANSFLKLVSACGVICVVLCAAATCFAQSEQLEKIPDRGFHPTASYSLGNIETINTTSGNLMLDIPLASLPAGRGGHPGFQLKLGYNSKIWDGEADVAPNPNNPNQNVDVTWLVTSDQGGWRYNIPKRYSTFMDNRNSHGTIYPANDCRHLDIWKLNMTFPDGSTREFRPYGHDDHCDDGYFRVLPAPGMSYFTIDGTYLRLDFRPSGEWTLFFPDGSRVEKQADGSQRNYDRNENFDDTIEIANYNNTGHAATMIVDQLGRSMVIEYGSSEDYIHATGVNGAPITTTVKWAITRVTKTYRAGNHFQYDVNWVDRGVSVISEIILPTELGANLKYVFGYNGWPTSGLGLVSVGWGELSSITLPSGARADYQYFRDNQSGTLIQADWVLENAPKRKDLNYTLEYDGVSTAAPTETWLYHLDDGFASISSPDGGVTNQWFSPSPQRGRVYKTQRPDGTVIESIWKENRPYQPPGVTIPDNIRVNPYIETEFTSIPDANGALVKASIKSSHRDKNGNVTQINEYDWVPYSSIPRDSFGMPTGIPAGATLKRQSTATYYSATPDAADSTTDNPNVYHRSTAPRLLKLLFSAEAGDGSQAFARSESFYDANGNLTQQKSWDSTKGGYSNPLSGGNSISTSTQYNQYGSPILNTDARGYQTQMIYGPVGSFSDLYATQIKTAFGTTIQRTATTEYDFNSGLVTRSTDVDNNVSNETDYDVFGRPIEIRVAANVPAAKAVTHMEYSDTFRRVISRSDLNSVSDGMLVRIKHYDQLGRVRLTRQLENPLTESATNETHGIKVQTRYKYSGVNNYQITSHPYREAYSTQAPPATMDWTRSKADNGGLVKEVKKFSGTNLPDPWSDNTNATGEIVITYDADSTTLKDEANNLRRSVVDGLGRLVRVDEPDNNNNLDVLGVPFQSTSYSYNALDRLLTVTQGNQTPRSFVYDSLKRMSSSTHPESGTSYFQYDNNSNLTQRTDARLVVTTYAYDALNRNTSITYSNDPAGTPGVYRTYDLAINGKGRLWSTQTAGNSGNASIVDSYDALGRPQAQHEEFSYPLGGFYSHQVVFRPAHV